jgi:TPR repeat protein
MGHTYAMNELGAIFLYGRSIPREPARGLEFYRAGAERKDIYSYNNLGLAYLDGTGVPRDLRKANEYLRMASDGGHPSAPSQIGRMYRDGILYKRDIRQATRWFEIGTERGDAWSAFFRSELSANGGNGSELTTTARFLALAVAFDRNGANPTWRDQLAALSSDSKTEAVRELARSLDEPVPQSTGALDQVLIDLSKRAWQSRNPRIDLF